MLTIAAASHLDHGLTPEHIVWLLETFADRNEFFIETVDIPAHLPAVTSALYGPVMGDLPIAESEVWYTIRGGRRCASRVLASAAAPRPTRMLTVVAGPHEGAPCVLFTAYGGYAAPREPGDTTIPSWEADGVAGVLGRARSLCSGRRLRVG